MSAGRTRSSMSVQSIPAPGPPNNIKSRVNQEKGTVTISWKLENGIAKYKIFRKKEGTNKFKLVKTIPGTTGIYSEKIPGRAGILHFYKIQAVGKTGMKSRDSKTVAGFINEFRPIVMTPFVPGDGMKNFIGTWRATHWEPGKKPRKMVLSIKGKGTGFSVKIKYANIKTKTFTGNYAAKSRYLQSKNLRFELLEAFENDIANVVISRGIFSGPRLVLKFARDMPKKQENNFTRGT